MKHLEQGQTVLVRLQGAAAVAARVDAAVTAVVHDGGPEGPGHEARAVNVSGGGLLLTGIGHLHVGDFAWVALDLEDGTAPIEALVTVVREELTGARAVRIASISARDEQRIVRFSFVQQQRARIAKGA